MWLCGYVALWLCGFVAVWLCGFVAVWPCDCHAFWCHRFLANEQTRNCHMCIYERQKCRNWNSEAHIIPLPNSDCGKNTTVYSLVNTPDRGLCPRIPFPIGTKAFEKSARRLLRSWLLRSTSVVLTQKGCLEFLITNQSPIAKYHFSIWMITSQACNFKYQSSVINVQFAIMIFNHQLSINKYPLSVFDCQGSSICCFQLLTLNYFLHGYRVLDCHNFKVSRLPILEFPKSRSLEIIYMKS